MNNDFDGFLLQQLQGSARYIDDGDFSARVLASLPVQKRLNPWAEKLIVLLPATLIGLLVLSQFSLREVIQPAYAWMLTLDMSTLVSVAAIFVIVALVAPILFFVKPQSLI